MSIRARLARKFVSRLVAAPRYLASHFHRRDPRLWVFGNSRGFRDNSRYLAEHVLHSNPEIAPWWIGRDPEAVAAARAAGLNAARQGSAQAARVQRRAGAAFLCTDFADLELVHLGGTFLVHLRHGKGLKRILLDWDVSEVIGGPRPLARAFTAANRWFLARQLAQVDMVVAAGEMAKGMFVSAFGCPPSRVPVLGTPRFDVILGGSAHTRTCGVDLRARLGFGRDDYIVLWLPTWRERGDASWLPVLDGSAVRSLLDGTRVRLLAKPHPNADLRVFEERLPEHPRVRLMAEDEVDTNCLLHVADALVTDYSSVAFDFSILGRPLHFLMPDLEEYVSGRGLYAPVEELTGGSHHEGWSSLLTSVVECARGLSPAGIENAARVREFGGLRPEPGSCARIVGAVAEAMGREARTGTMPGFREGVEECA